MKKLIYIFTILIFFSTILTAKPASKYKIQRWKSRDAIQTDVFAPKTNPFNYAKKYSKMLSSVHIMGTDNNGNWKDSVNRVVVTYDKVTKKYINSRAYDLTFTPKAGYRIESSQFTLAKFNDGLDLEEESINGLTPLISKEQQFVGGKWNDSMVSTIVIDPNNSNILSQTYKYPTNGVLNDDYRYRFLFDAKGRFVGTLTEYYNLTTKKWETNSGDQVIYKYDSKNNITECSLSVYIDTIGAFAVIAREVYTLKADGSITSALKSEYSFVNKRFEKTDSISNIEWQVFDKARSYFYPSTVLFTGGKKFKRFVLNKYYDGLGWEALEEYKYKYDASNRLLLQEIGTYNSDSSKFITDQNNSFEYYPNGDLKYADEGVLTAGIFLAKYINKYYNTYDKDGDITSAYSTAQTSSLAYSDKTLFFYNGSVIGIEDESSNSTQVKLYPNPAHENLQIQSPDFKINKVEILSMDGKLIKSFENLNMDGGSINLNVSDLQNGIYLIRNSSSNASMIGKFIKE